jgi:hypothetical protein
MTQTIEEPFVAFQNATKAAAEQRAAEIAAARERYKVAIGPAWRTYTEVWESHNEGTHY